MLTEARHEEIRQLLQQILQSGESLKGLAVDKENGPQYVGEIMETIQMVHPSPIRDAYRI